MRLRLPRDARSRPPTSWAGTARRAGKGYNAEISWHDDQPEPDLLGYSVMIRKTTSPVWEKEIFVGKVMKYTLENVNIDEVVLGVKAIDKEGNESLASAYVTPPYKQAQIKTY